MVEVMEIMATSFKRSHVRTATLSAPNTAAGHRRPMSSPETPGRSQASLGQSLVGSLFPSTDEKTEVERLSSLNTITKLVK